MTPEHLYKNFLDGYYRDNPFQLASDIEEMASSKLKLDALKKDIEQRISYSIIHRIAELSTMKSEAPDEQAAEEFKLEMCLSSITHKEEELAKYADTLPEGEGSHWSVYQAHVEEELDKLRSELNIDRELFKLLIEINDKRRTGEQLLNEISNHGQKFEPNIPKSEAKGNKEVLLNKMQWHASKTDLYELVKALIETKAIKEHTEREVFEKLFSFFNVEFSKTDKSDSLTNVKSKLEDDSFFTKKMFDSIQSWRTELEEKNRKNR